MNDESISLCRQKSQANEHGEVCPGVLTLSLPQVTKTEFLITISIHYQAGR